MSAIIAWVMANWGMIASVLLGISEALHLAFPASTGFGGFIASAISFLKNLGAQPPASS